MNKYQDSSESFNRFFLMEFTKELINNYRRISLQKVAKREEEVKEQIKKIEFLKVLPKKEKVFKPVAKIKPKPLFPRRIISVPLALKIPEPRLPPQFSYLAPIPSSEEIGLGKLNPLIRDPLVKVIECNGPNEHTIVHGAMGRKPTEIILNKEEIDGIISKFSEAAKIPVTKGIYKVVVGRLILSAIISDIIGSKFIIRKMTYTASTPLSQGFVKRETG